MSLTFTRVPDGEDVWGRTKVTLFDVTLDNSYPLTNGYTINAQDVGLKFFKSAIVEGSNKTGGSVLPIIDLGIGTTGAGSLPLKVALRVFTPTGGATGASSVTAPSFAEGAITIGGTATATPASGATAVTSTSAQPAIPVNLSSVTGTIASGAATAGIGKEFANGADLSSIIVRIRFFG